MMGYCGAKGGIGVQYLKFSALHCIAKNSASQCTIYY